MGKLRTNSAFLDELAVDDSAKSPPDAVKQLAVLPPPKHFDCDLEVTSQSSEAAEWLRREFEQDRVDEIGRTSRRTTERNERFEHLSPSQTSRRLLSRLATRRPELFVI
jgi:hypothetical protein